MKVTSREVTLIIALSTVAIIYVLYTFLFSPLLMNISVAKETLNSAEMQKSQVEIQIESIPEIKIQQEALIIEAEKLVEGFIPDINEDVILTFFAGTQGKGGPVVDKISFDQQAVVNLETMASLPYVGISYPYRELVAQYKGTVTEAVGEEPTPVTEGQPGNAVLAQGVTIGLLSSTYEQTINQMKIVEALKRTVTVDVISLSKDDTGNLTGTIHYNFYGIDKLTDNDKGLDKTVLSESNGKTNPFN